MKEYDYQKGLWNPYLAGVVLGLILLVTFYVMGSGLGASGAVARTAVVTAHVVAPSAVENNGYMSRFYKPGKKSPFVNWIFFEVIGVFIGGFLGALTGSSGASVPALPWVVPAVRPCRAEPQWFWVVGSS